MDDYRSTNRAHWDELATLHPDTDFYDVDGFLAGETTLLPLERDELGDVAGQSLLHLQCHFGLDTLSWARQGAIVTGLDFSETAVETARELMDEANLEGRFVCADVYDAPDVLNEQFEVVFTSYGAIYWLPDIDRWAEVVADCLVPGGSFYIAEVHPFAGCLEATEDGAFQFVYPYFESDEPIVWDDEELGSYADRDATLEQTTTYEWPHGLGEITTAICDAGLSIEFVHEFPWSCFGHFPEMEPDDEGRWWLPEEAPEIPLTFSLRATKTE